MTWLRRLVSRAAARDLPAFVVPDYVVARLAGIDLEAAGLRQAATPRHASVLLLVGPIPDELTRAATVAYAQMPRPRAIVAAGTEHLPGLPHPDVVTTLEQGSLAAGIAELRRKLADGAFSPEAVNFDLEAIRTRTEYVCPMHPEIVRPEPGSCPICGMDLVPRESVESMEAHDHASMAMDHESVQHEPAPAAEATYTCPMHPEVVQDEPGSCPICGMDLVPRDAGPRESDHEAGTYHHHQPHSPGLEERSSYTCPMHPEVVQDEPGTCPICGMRLVPREVGEQDNHDLSRHDLDSGATTAHGRHARAEREAHGAHTGPLAEEHDAPAPPHAGHSPSADKANHAAGHGPPGAIHTDQAADYEHHNASAQPDPHTAGNSQHQPQMVDEAHVGHAGAGHDSGEHGLDHRDHLSHAQHDSGEPQHAMHGAAASPQLEHEGHDMATGKKMGHSGHTMDHGDHGDGFMSMVAMTKDLPRSSDGLPMEWVDVPFGPLFPGLPGGLALTLTLDGDTVARARVTPGATRRALETSWLGPSERLYEHLAELDRLAPYSYAVLGWQAIDSSSSSPPNEAAQRGRAGALEHARAISHLGWLTAFGRLLGYPWLEGEAGALLQALVGVTDVSELPPVRDAVARLIDRIDRTPMLQRRLEGVGVVDPSDGRLTGPVARAAGHATDTRSTDPVYQHFGFEPVTRFGCDALARLEVRLGEVAQSLDLIQAAGTFRLVAPRSAREDATEAMATLELPRGEAMAHIVLDQSQVSAVHLMVPSSTHVSLVPTVAEGVELVDALVGIASLDVSPWEIDQ